MRPMQLSLCKSGKRPALIAATAGLFLLLSAPLATTEAAPCAAGTIAERAGTAFVTAARSRSASAFAGALRKHTDMRAISLFALGKHRKKLPKSSEGRFVKHFDKEGEPSETLLRSKEDRLQNWHLLQELAGLR